MGSWGTQIAQLQTDSTEAFKVRMAEMADKLGVAKDCCFLPLGRPAYEIKRLSEEKNVDLIVIGTHGQHGFELLLGSTANAVLHGVGCDVLAVRTIEAKNN